MLPIFFLAGCQKTGSTWIYKCLKEHPEVFVPEKDAIHFFTINYHKGLEWYARYYQAVANEKAVFDTTPSYIREALAAQRIFQLNPHAKLLFTLRNPIERAFSHYWHMKRKSLINYTFYDALEYGNVGNIDLYEMWIKSGFYYDLLLPFFQVFPRENIKILIYEDLVEDAEQFLKEIFQFAGVDESFKPSVLDRKINTAKSGIVHDNTKRNVSEYVKAGMNKLLSKINNNDTVEFLTEYEIGIEASYRAELQRIFKPKNDQLAKLIDRDLDFWQ